MSHEDRKRQEMTGFGHEMSGTGHEISVAMKAKMCYPLAAANRKGENHMPPGFMLYHDHVNSAARLTDAEFGRLIRALAAYSETENVPELQGPEVYLFDLFRAVVDTNKAKYRERCETNRKNCKGGRKGAKSEKEAKPQAAPDTEVPMSPTMDNDRQRSFTTGHQRALNINKNINKKINIKECPPYSPPKGTPPGDTGRQRDRETGDGSVSPFIPRKGDAELSLCLPGPSPVSSGFEKFYAAYPLQVAKQDALKAWNRLNPDPALREVILAAIERQKQCDQWNREGGRFIPNPANWLRGCRWEDDLRKTQPQASAQRNSMADFSQRDYHDSQEESLTELLDRMEKAMAEQSTGSIIPAGEAPKPGL